MFADEQFYEAKVFLRSYKDAIDCLKESAEKKQNMRQYEHMVTRILNAKKNDEVKVQNGVLSQGANFKNSREVKLFQFSNYLFNTYLNNFDSFSGDYNGLKNLLEEGLDKIKKDLQ